jgi:vacuolar-type H+-ATPase subunit E/Vma4
VNVEPLRASLLASVAAETARSRADARQEGELRLGEAARRAEELVARARSLGESDAGPEVARRRLRARRRARALTLAARREVYEELRREAVAAALSLRGTEPYPALLERLAAAAREQLGGEATLELDPPEQGGVIASSGERRVDYTLPALVDRCLAGSGMELRRLWP